jgi:CheY-like chemotaxis protein
MNATILVVEDEPFIASDIKKTLEALGYVVPPPVASGQQALEAVIAHRPDLVLMDIRIQGEIDGIETAARIGKNHGTPVVYLTSYSDDATLARAKITGAYGYLLKPFEDRDLRTAIEVASSNDVCPSVRAGLRQRSNRSVTRSSPPTWGNGLLL